MIDFIIQMAAGFIGGFIIGFAMRTSLADKEKAALTLKLEKALDGEFCAVRNLQRMTAVMGTCQNFLETKVGQIENDLSRLRR